MGAIDDPINFTGIGAQQYSDDQFVVERRTLTHVPTASRANSHFWSCSTFDIWTTSPT